MSLYIILLVTVLTHTSYKGSKVLISLFAMELGATPMTVGVLFASYSLFPVFLSLYAGKLSDRLGARWPMLFGVCGLFTGLCLPFVHPAIGALYASAIVTGLCYIFYTVSVQHLIGAIGEGQERTRNYSLFSLFVGFTSLLGPLVTGYAIDTIGHRHTYLLLATMPLVPILVLAFGSRWLPRTPAREEKPKGNQRFVDLLAHVPLRRVLITSGIIETGLELFNFFLPIYARSHGLTATEIGIVMGAFAAALLVVRTTLPKFVQRSSEEGVLCASLFLAAATCLLFPFCRTFWPLFGAAFLLGLGLGCGSPLSMILAYNRSPAGRAGEAMGIRQMVNKGSEVLMPLIFGSFSTAFGMTPVFLLDALVLGVGAVLMRREAQRTAATQAAAPPS